MGGKLYDLPRMPRADYVEREAEVRAHLERVLPGRFRIPRYYGDKPDFGDMDVICAAGPDWEAERAAVVEGLGITRTRVVGHVWSTVYRDLQTDFFAVEPEVLDATANFMSFNDLGNLIGRMVRRFDLKYGERGLTRVYRRAGSGHYKAEIAVSRDMDRICRFLGLDPAPWHAGFPSLDALFEWVVTSPWFSVAPYLDAPDGPMGARAAVRPTIARFVAWLVERGIDRRPVFDERDSYLPMVCAAFPEAELERRIAEEQALEARATAFAAKFDGKRVMALRPELEGAALGRFIQAFKRAVPDFESWVLETPLPELEDRIRAFEVP